MVDAARALAPRLVYSVAALVQAVSDALAARFSACAVAGEIAGWSRAASGHVYFTLRDPDGHGALIRCAMFRRAATLIDFAPGDGQRVEVRGRVTVYEPRGELQLVVESMRRAGEGTLLEQFMRLKERLEAQGLFDAARKRPLPRFVRTVGVVTSPDAAALRDVATAFARRAPHVRLIVYPSPVQGATASAALAAAVTTAARRAEVDVLLVVRGGGSLEDLWAFNDEAVVRAIAASSIPTICGVGHETDVTLADHAADLRAPTPTAAAELAAPTRAELWGALQATAQRARRRVEQVLAVHDQRLDRAALRLARPAFAAVRHRERLDRLAMRLHGALTRGARQRRDVAGALGARVARAAARRIEGARHQLATLDARRAALDPGRVLARGYAWLGDEAGAPVTSVTALHAGDAVRATLVDGSAALRVLDVERGPQVQHRQGDADKP